MTNHSFAFASGAPRRSRSSSAAFAAVAAVGIISGTLVTLQLSGPPAAGAATVAAAPIQTTQTAKTSDLKTSDPKTWDLEPRWWGGETRRAEQPAAPSTASSATPSTTPARTVAATVPESELTFTKGYALRLAARKAAGQVAEGKTGAARPAIVARTAPARTASAPRSLTAPTRVEPAIEPPAASDTGSQALAFDAPRGFGTPHAAVFPNLFGRLY